MTEMPPSSGDLRDATAGAGVRLRQAREARGMSLDDLAVALKVAVPKLAALEAGRFDELHDATFVRALALAVCRHLKVDPQPVLALLPGREVGALSHVTRGIDEPFRARGDAGALASGVAALRRPLVLVPLVAALLGAAALAVVPQGSWQWVTGLWSRAASAPVQQPGDAPMPALPSAALAEPASTAVAVSDPVASTAAAMPAPSQADAAAELAAAPAPADVASAAAASLWVSVSGDAWVEVVDATGTALQRGTLRKGEDKVVAGTPPLRVRLGNAEAVTLRYRGQPVNVKAVARYGRATLELK